MFGYIRINKMELKFKEYYTYKGYYCGLCRSLKHDFGEISRLSLNYDMTFLILLLSSLYDVENSIISERCIANPLKKTLRIENEITKYAADMNVVLTFNKIMDNIQDDGRLRDYIAKVGFKNSYKRAYLRHKQKSDFFKLKLDELKKYELNGETNIDIVSNTFADIMRKVFEYKEDENSLTISNIGFNIGKYIYILDAYEDLDDDIKKNRYNPFRNYKDDKESLKRKVDNNILMILSFLEEDINKLDFKKNKSIIDNIIYSGLYLRYKSVLEEGAKNERSI